ncbi:alpha-galactosidase, partial [Conyzicola sp.]|uniref:alpha-galactosidase n=1 Tax=Conyzicola sp. TaxID=1969404 RepID=UPI0039894908
NNPNTHPPGPAAPCGWGPPGATGVPVIVHWGSDLGALARDALEALVDSQMPAVGPSSIDTPLRQSILPVMADGWNGRPGIAGHFEGSTPHAPAFTLSAAEPIPGAEPVEAGLLITLDATNLTVVVDIDLSADGVLRQRLTVTNTGDSVYALASLDATLPIPTRARELLDFTGRWPRERQPQRRDLANGTWTRDSRHGRPGHDNAFLMVAGTPGFGFRSGEVWGAHLAWSGDQRLWAESASTGQTLLGGGELFEPGEVRLAPHESFESPWLVSAFSDAGLDGLARSFHRFIRSRRRLSTRKVMLNTWEAVYFDQSAERLKELADAAASVGVERFVLDDGWMIGRTDDRRALGDWIVDPVKWPDGLHPLVDHVLSLGMDFGLWVEPEMVSLDSAVAREHPEWVLGADNGELPLPWRWQQVLDLANPEAFAHVHEQLAALLREYPISYLKWDQNRDLLGGSAHRHTTATYALMDALRAEFPGLEIESCSSGGGRVDLGVIERTDRVWPSDTNDSLERQAIYRWTAGLVPPEFLGAHLGAPTAHTTGRTHELSFRLATALFGHSGIEWDVTTLDDADRVAVAEWVAAYKLHRGLLHSGDVVRSDAGDATRWVHGVVASDASSALFAVVAMTATRDAIVGPTTLPGLDPSRDYRVTPVRLGAWPRVVQDAPPPWWDAGGVTMSGRMLAAVGIPMPLLAPEQALVLHVEQVE